MDKALSHLSARTFCHATEDLERVKTALLNVTGDAAPRIRRVEGIHGNPIWILESHLEGREAATSLFRRIAISDLRAILDSLDTRLDEGCNLFVRFDKQSAFAGALTLTESDDVILVRLKVQTYPAKPETARRLVREFITQELSARGA